MEWNCHFEEKKNLSLNFNLNKMKKNSPLPKYTNTSQFCSVPVSPTHNSTHSTLTTLRAKNLNGNRMSWKCFFSFLVLFLKDLLFLFLFFSFSFMTMTRCDSIRQLLHDNLQNICNNNDSNNKEIIIIVDIKAIWKDDMSVSHLIFFFFFQAVSQLIRQGYYKENDSI